MLTPFIGHSATFKGWCLKSLQTLLSPNPSVIQREVPVMEKGESYDIFIPSTNKVLLRHKVVSISENSVQLVNMFGSKAISLNVGEFLYTKHQPKQNIDSKLIIKTIVLSALVKDPSTLLKMNFKLKEPIRNGEILSNNSKDRRLMRQMRDALSMFDHLMVSSGHQRPANTKIVIQERSLIGEQGPYAHFEDGVHLINISPLKYNFNLKKQPSVLFHERFHSYMLEKYEIDSYIRTQQATHEAFADFHAYVMTENPIIGHQVKTQLRTNEMGEKVFEVTNLRDISERIDGSRQLTNIMDHSGSYHSNSLFISQVLHNLSQVFTTKVQSISFSKRVIERLDETGNLFKLEADKKLNGETYDAEFLTELSAFLKAVELEASGHEKSIELLEILRSWRESNQFYL